MKQIHTTAWICTFRNNQCEQDRWNVSISLYGHYITDQ